MLAAISADLQHISTWVFFTRIALAGSAGMLTMGAGFPPIKAYWGTAAIMARHASIFLAKTFPRGMLIRLADEIHDDTRAQHLLTGLERGEP